MAIPDWLSISQLSGSGDTVITITADSYSQIAERVTSLRISGNTKHVDVEVRQSGTPIGITPSVITVGSSTTITTVSVSSVEAWEMNDFSSYNWLSWSQTAGTAGNTVVTLTAATNSSGNDRVAHVNFCSSGVCVPLTVTQTVNDNWDVIATYNFTGAQKRILDDGAYMNFQDKISVDGVIQDISTSITASNGVHTVMLKSRIPGELGLYGGFYQCTALTDVVICDTIEHIYTQGMFERCTNLSAVTLSNNLKTINKYGTFNNGSGTFNGTKIASLTLPSSLEYIGRYTFHGMNYLTGLTIPHGCFVADYAFGLIFDGAASAGTASTPFQLTIPDDAFVVNDNEGIFASYYGKNIQTQSAEWDRIRSHFELENHVFYAGQVAIGVDDKTLSSYTIRNGTKYINQACFYSANTATTISVPSSVKSVGDTSFYVNGLAQSGSNEVVTAGPVMIEVLAGVPDTTLTLSSDIRCTTHGGWYPERNYNVYELVIPGTVNAIGGFSFNNLLSVDTVTIQDGVKYIGYVFGSSNQATLTAVTVPNSVQYIDLNALHNIGHFGKSAVEVYNDNIYYHCPAGTLSTFMHSGVKMIAGGAFEGCSILESVSIPTSVKEIGLYAFTNCRNLESITIPNNVENMVGWSFNGCSALTNLTLSENIKVIDESFSGCTSLTRLTINSPTLYGVDFSNAANFEELTLGSRVKAVYGINAKVSGGKLKTIKCYGSEAPAVMAAALTLPTYGTFHYPRGADYSKWVSALSSKNWTCVADL